MTFESKLVPPVVAVLVMDHSETSIDEVLEGIAGQTYENLQVVVLHRGQSSIQEHITSVVPGAVVKEVPDARSFGEAANQVQKLVEGAAFYLFLDEGTALTADSVSLLVEEAVQSNAGILGPKVLDWDDPSRIMSMGSLVDAFGVETAFVEVGELDQQQHDRVREAFTVSGEAVLVRSDLFQTLGGFDPRIDGSEAFLDLCWRAQIAGGRILVVPQATVRSRQIGTPQTASRTRRYSIRHRQHVIAKCYGWVYLLPVMFAALILSIVEIAYSMVTLRFGHSRDVLAAWGWNFLQARHVIRSRREISRLRKTRDRDIRRRQAAGSTRLRNFLQGQIGGEIALQSLRSRAVGQVSASFSAGPRRVAFLSWAVIAAVLMFGSRHLLTQGVPIYGQFSSFPDTDSLLSSYWSGWREVGVGAAGIGPAALALLGGLSWLSLGTMDLVRQVLILSLVPVGLLGMWRLLKPIDSVWGRIVGTSLYATLPISYEALFNGRWGTLLLVAAVPFAVRRVAEAFGVENYAPDSSRMLQQAASLGLLLGVVAAFEPLILVLVPVASIVVLGARIGKTSVRAVGRGLVIVCLAIGVGSLMHLPWVAAMGNSDSVLRYLLVRSPAESSTDLGGILRFLPASYGNSWMMWCPLLVALLPLLLGRGNRLRLAMMAGFLAVAGYALAWVSHRGWLTDLLRREMSIGEGALVLAGVGLCWCAAVGPSAVSRDGDLVPLVVKRIVVTIAAASLMLSSLTLLVGSANGRWGTPTNDLTVSLSLLDDRDIGPSYRILWLGDQAVLPLKGWAVGDEGLYAGTSVRGHPDIRHQWGGLENDGHRQLVNAVEIGLSGNTTRMGRLLAPFGIRYVALVERSTPSFSVGLDRPIGQRTRQAIDSQLDLRPLATDPSVTVLTNESWMSSRSQFVSSVRLAGLDEPGELVVTDLSSGIPVLTDRRSPTEQHGFVDAGEVLVADAYDPHWRLLVGGKVVTPDPSFGWAMRFQSPSDGAAALWYQRPDSIADRAIVQIVLWIVIVRLAVSERRKRLRFESPS